MNMVEFSNQIPSEQLIMIFKNFFEEHVATYDLAPDMSAKEITESLLKELDKDRLINYINKEVNFKKKLYLCEKFF